MNKYKIVMSDASIVNIESENDISKFTEDLLSRDATLYEKFKCMVISKHIVLILEGDK